ncbi:MAG: hypothetical protein VXB01_14370, partial [Opitutae bacterium]
MPYQDLSVGSTANKPKSEPSFFDKISQGIGNFVDSFSGGNDDPAPVSGGRGNVVERPNERNDYLAAISGDNNDPSPAPVSGGRGNVVERPNERNDYLAAILQQQSDNAIVPPPSAADAAVGFVPPKDRPDYSGNVDRYSIPVGNMIPESLGSVGNFLPFQPDLSGVNPRAIADSFGLTDLSNINPVTTMFVRPRDAAARFSEPEKYSPTGEREWTDLLEAGMGPLEAFLGLGASRYLREPIEKGLGAVFGLDTDISGPNRSDETLRLYHGTPSEGFTPQQKVRMPDGSTQYIDMFQVAGGRPGDMSMLQSLAPEGAEVLETYPYGRLSTDYVGTGEGGMTKGSYNAATSQAGALAGKGIYFGSKPNISQVYRYINSSGIPFVPYKDSKKDGVGQETLKVVQPAIIDQYGSLEAARYAYNFGDSDVFSFNVGGEEFSFKTPASVNVEVDNNFENVLETIKSDPVLSSYYPNQSVQEMLAGKPPREWVSMVSKKLDQRLKNLTPELLRVQSKADNQIDRMFPLPRT